MKKFILIIFITFSAQTISAQNNPLKLAGVYQRCILLLCETIKLNADLTFDYRIDGDLLNGERTNGVWKFVGENKIYLKSPDKKVISKVSENQIKRNDDKISIQTAIPDAGVTFSGVIIKVNYSGIKKQFVTDQNGTCEIPKTDEVEVFDAPFSEKYRIKNAETNQLIIELPAIYQPFVDDFFCSKDNQLFPILDGKDISDNSYRKLKKKDSNKLFPKN